MEASFNISNQNFSLLGKGSKIKGTFIFSGLTRLNSSIEGEIVMETSDDLYIEKDAVVNGHIKCHNLNIYGIFEGTIMATGKVCLYPCSQMTGKVSASHLQIHPGALVEFEGHTIES